MSSENRRYSEKFALRMPDGMRDQIEAVATANNRSMNAEIVARLEASFDAGSHRRPVLGQSSVEERLQDVEAAAGDLKPILSELDRLHEDATASAEKTAAAIARLEVRIERLEKRGLG